MMLTDGLVILDRVSLAVQLVRERLQRASDALAGAGLPYAFIGANAVMLWVKQHGEGGERNTPNVDLLVRRADLVPVTAALERVGFCPNPTRPDLFRDGPDGSPRTRLRLLFAEEKVCETDLLSNPALTGLVVLQGFPVLPLAALVQTKLTAWRLVDRVHLIDMLDVGLIDAAWKECYPPELAERLQWLIDDPDG